MKKELMVGVVSSVVTALILVVAYSFMNSQTAGGSYDAPLMMRSYAEDAKVAEAGASGETMLTYSFSMTVKVVDLPVAESSARATIEGFGGYLAGASGNYERQKSTTLSFKVPSESLEEAGAAMKALGEVESESLDAYDVKSQYDELSARLESLDAERIRLIEFYDQANKTSDLIEISNRLSYVDSQLNYLNLRKAELEDLVSYSTLSVTFEEKMGALSKFIWVELADLFGRFSSGLNSSLSGLFWIVGMAIPIGVLVFVVCLFRKKKRKKKKR